MTTYHPSKLKPLAKIIARMVANNTKLAEPENEGLFMATLAANIPGFGNKEVCLNCSASMAEYEDIIDVNDVLLLHAMAKEVRAYIDKGLDFTEANKVRVSLSPNIGHTQKCRTSKCRNLGLIAKAGKAHWAITRRGWQALAGKQVPKSRLTFRGKIIDRPDELTTFQEVLDDHRRKMDDLQKRGKATQFDYRTHAAEYDPSEWYTIGGYHEGEVI